MVALLKRDKMSINNIELIAAVDAVVLIRQEGEITCDRKFEMKC